jgi:tRNA A-37 threonylcarbamoyl transferase component Bud32
MIYLAPQYLPILQKKEVSNYAGLLTLCQGEIINDSSKNTTWRDHWQSDDESFYVFIKRYQNPLSPRYLYPRVPRALVEMDSYLYWQKCGIAGPEVIAAGAHNQLGFHRSSLIITREISAAQDLIKLCQQPDFYQNQALLASVFDQLAELLATAHQARFYHFDLHFRNIMVAQPKDQPSARVYWIDSPRGKCKTFASRYLQTKDLACLYRACHEQQWPQMWQRLSTRYYEKMAYDQTTINRLKQAIARRLGRRADTRGMNDPI